MSAATHPVENAASAPLLASHPEAHAAAADHARNGSAIEAEQSAFTTANRTTVDTPQDWLAYGGSQTTVPERATVWAPPHYNDHVRVVDFRPSPDAVFKIDLSGALANPAPLGLFSFAMTTMFLSTVNAGLVDADFSNLVFCYALILGGLVQLVAGVLEFFKKNTFGATVFCTYAGFWMGFGLFEFLAHIGAISPKALQGGLSGFFGMFAALSIVYTVASMRISIALFSTLVAVDFTFFLLIGGLYSTTVQHAAGWFGMIAAAIAFYVGTATFLAEIFNTTVLPVGNLAEHWVKRAAIPTHEGHKQA